MMNIIEIRNGKSNTFPLNRPNKIPRNRLNFGQKHENCIFDATKNFTVSCSLLTFPNSIHSSNIDISSILLIFVLLFLYVEIGSCVGRFGVILVDVSCVFTK